MINRTNKPAHKIVIAFTSVAFLIALIALLVLVGCSGSRVESANDALHDALLLSGVAAEPVCPDPVIYDTGGTEQSLEWLSTKYGNVNWQCADPHPDADYVFVLSELRESCGPAVIITTVRDENGNPLPNKAVIRYWPGAPSLPNYDPPASRWTDLGVYGFTNAEGVVGFGTGTGDYYLPPDEGATWIYIADADGPSGVVRGIGMLALTEHCTVFPLFIRTDKDDILPPTPTPTEEPTVEPIPVPEGMFEIEKFYIQLVPIATATPNP